MLKRFDSVFRLGVVTLLAHTACVNTKVTPIPVAARPLSSYDRILIVFPVSDLLERARTEDAFQRAYDGEQVTFVASNEAFPVGRPYAPEKVAATLVRDSVDAVMLFLPPDDMFFDGRPRKEPALVQAFEQDPLAVMLAALFTGAGVNAMASSTDPWARFAVALREVRTGRVVWMAAARASASFAGQPGRYFRSIAKETVLQLRRERLIP